MNSKERLEAVLSGKAADRIPNLNILMTFAAREIGAKYKDFCLCPDVMIKGNMACAEKYGIDVVTVMSDPMTEAYDLGAEVVFPEDDVPHAAARLLADEGALASLSPIAPENGKRMSSRIETIRRYKKETAGSIPVVGWVEGCFAEAADLRGVNEFLMDAFDGGDFLKDLLDLCLEQAKLFAKAQIEAGADIIGVGDAIASVAGPDIYKSTARGYQREILRYIKQQGARTKLHICGNIQPFLHLLPFDYIDILDIDWMVPLKEAVEKVPDTIILSGNYDPVSVMQDMTKQEVAKAVISCAEIAKGRKYATAAGCEIPKATPQENLLCVNEALAGI